MTRLTQKEIERATLQRLLAATHIVLQCDPIDSEAPDFIIQSSGRSIGVEMTMYQSGKTVAGVRKRAIEAEWELLEQSSRSYRSANAELHGLYILFRFKTALPSRNEHSQFLQEILEFLRVMRPRLGPEPTISGGPI